MDLRQKHLQQNACPFATCFENKNKHITIICEHFSSHVLRKCNTYIWGRLFKAIITQRSKKITLMALLPSDGMEGFGHSAPKYNSYFILGGLSLLRVNGSWAAYTIN